MRRMILCSTIFVASMLLFQDTSEALALPRAKITIKVLDEAGIPVEGAEVGIGFEKNTGWGTKEIGVDGHTNKDGLFTGAAFANNHVGFSVAKQGYYRTAGQYDFESQKFGRWLPWNPEIVLPLRKIENPAPMYARTIKLAPLEIPVSERPIGFDLIEYDWVSPYGKGKHPDFIFRLDRVFVNDRQYDGKLTITFPNDLDGIQAFKQDRQYGSDFKLPRFAPIQGYDKELGKYRRREPGKIIDDNFNDDNNYIFRVRSETRDGILFRAMYGKIQGDIEFSLVQTETAVIMFTYYLNPDYTHNLEFGKNLFEDIPALESPSIDQ